MSPTLSITRVPSSNGAALSALTLGPAAVVSGDVSSARYLGHSGGGADSERSLGHSGGSLDDSGSASSLARHRRHFMRPSGGAGSSPSTPPIVEGSNGGGGGGGRHAMTSGVHECVGCKGVHLLDASMRAAHDRCGEVVGACAS